MIFRLIVALFLSIAALVPTSSTAQTASAPASSLEQMPEPLTQEAVREMVARMSDDEVRAMLLARLDAVAQQDAGPVAESKSLATEIRDTALAMGASWWDAISKVPNLISSESRAISNFAGKFGSSGLVQLFGYILIALAVALAVEWLTVRLLGRARKLEAGTEAQDLWGAVRFLVRRFMHELVGLIAFYVVLRLFGLLLFSEQQLAFAGPFVIYLIWIPRLGAALSRLVLAPNRSDLRLVNVNDRWARYLHRNLIGLFLLGGFTVFLLQFNAANGVPIAEIRIGFWLNTLLHLYIIAIAWTAREGLTEMMRGTDPDRTEFDETIARLYPKFAIAVSVVMWLVVEAIVAAGSPEMVALVTQGPSYVTMFWLLMAPALDTLIRGLVRHLVPPMQGEGKLAEEAYRATKRGYIRIGRMLAAVFVILMVAKEWGVSLIDFAGTGESIGSKVVEALLILAVAYVANEVVSLWINRKLAREQTSAEVLDVDSGGEGGGAGGSRLATVLPLLRVSASVTIAVLGVLLALGEVGINITPLLAGAGVVGLAIGFGAQKLVSDIVGGIFFLIDDAFRIGEYVDVGGTSGTVEKISIRSMQLRHHRGPVHTIPYGEIQKLTNFSRDWVIMKLKFTVPFDTDPNKVKKIFKKIGAEMMEDPLYKNDFLEPFKSQGVFDFDDVGMVIRGKFMAKPGTQFTIRKEIYNRVKKAFAEAGIEFARREVRVAIPGLDEAEQLSDAEKEAVAGAAAQAAQQQVEAQQSEK